MILTDKEIRSYCLHKDDTAPLISPFQESQLQAASYDVRLSGKITSFKKSVQTIDLSQNENFDLYDQHILSDNDFYILQPNEYILAELHETVSLPANLVAHLRPRTRFTRLGLLIADQHCNPTYSGTLFIGLRNVSPNGLKIRKDMMIAQIVFEELSSTPSEEKWYKNKKNAGYMGESSFRGSIPAEQGWSETAREVYNEIISSLMGG